MLKVFIVDDEPIILQGLKKLIDWNQLGCKIVGEAFDGEEALEIIHEINPDIIITDLLMPELGGLDFIKKVNNMGNSPIIIILSGYGEFEYAREAIKNGVFEYLLKPVTEEHLTDVIQKVTKIIRGNRQSENKLDRLKEQLSESMPLLKEKFLLELLTGIIDNKNEIKRKAQLMDLDLEGNSYTVIAAELDNTLISNTNDNKDKLNLIKTVQNILKDVTGTNYKSYIVISDDKFYILLIGSGARLSPTEIINIASKVKCCLEAYLNLTATLSIGQGYSDILQAKKSFKDANLALNNKFFFGKDTIIHINKALTNKKCSAIYPEEEEKKVLESIRYCQGKDPAQLSGDIMQSFIHACGNNIDLIYNFCFEFCVQINRMLSRMMEEIPDFLPDLDSLEKEIRHNKTVNELNNWLKRIISLTEKKILDIRKSRVYDVIEDVKDYLNQNYSKDIKLNMVASRIYLSPTYFSALFKNKTGVNFYDYLVKIRMEAASKLLMDDTCKVYEVAQQVGYKSARCFSETFKRYFGVIPSTYKEKLCNGQLKKGV